MRAHRSSCLTSTPGTLWSSPYRSNGGAGTAPQGGKTRKPCPGMHKKANKYSWSHLININQAFLDVFLALEDSGFAGNLRFWGILH